MTMTAPGRLGGIIGIIVGIIVFRHSGFDTHLQIPQVFGMQSIGIVFRMSGDEHLASVRAGRQIDARFFRRGQYFQIRLLP